MFRHVVPMASAVALTVALILGSTLVVGAHYAVVTGQLEVSVAEDFSHDPIYQAWLRTTTGRIQLNLSSDEALSYVGSNVRVTLERGNGAVVHAGGAARPIDLTRISTTTGAAAATRNVAVLLVNFSNDARQPMTAAAASAVLLSNTDSVKNFFAEESRGAVAFSGQVFGWYTIPASNTGCDWSTWGDQARASATAAGVNLSAFSNVVVAWPSVSCGWSGLGYVNGPYTFINGSFTTRVVAHELGHNMGLMHANSTTCTAAGTRVSISTTCTSGEYGDPYSIMGTATSYHDHGAQVGELGWLNSGEMQTLAASGTYQLTPLLGTTPGSLHLLRVARGDGTWLYLDYRVTYGAVFDRFVAGSPAVSGVTIRISSADASPTGSAYPTSLVDATPETATFWDAPLPVGRSLFDPTGRITVTTVSIGSGVASVRVDLATTPPPSPAPSATLSPTPRPTTAATPTPTPRPTATPTRAPSATPSPTPSLPPTMSPTAAPTTVPTAGPTAPPTTAPTMAPTATPGPTLAPPSATATPSAPPDSAKIGVVRTIGRAGLSRSGNTSLSIAVPPGGVNAGDTVVVAVMAGTFKGAVSCSDSKGNAYSVDSDVISTARLFVCSAHTVTALTGGDTITVTYPGFSGTTVAVAAEFSGVAGLDQRVTAVGNGPRPTLGPLTTTGTPELLISAVSHASTPVFSFGCGFAPLAQTTVGSGSGQRTVDLGFQVVGLAGPHSVCGTLNPSAQWQGALLAYY